MDYSKSCIFHIEGGLGKHIAATGVARAIKAKYPDRPLVIVCGWPEIFLNLPFVDRVFRIGMTPYFYQDYIEGKDPIIMKHEPYNATSHITKKDNLIGTWCTMYGLDRENAAPELVFNLRQIQQGAQRWKRDRPIMVIQTNGGPMKDQPYPYSWTRDMPIDLSRKIVDAFNKEYHVIQVCRSREQGVPGAEVVFDNMSNMELLYLVAAAQKRVFIDSCLHHAAAAMNKKSTVLWIGTSPTVFGYALHTNVVAELPTGVKLPDSYLFDYNFHGAVHECPLVTPDLFDASIVINAIAAT